MPLVDVTQPWSNCDLVLVTKDSEGRQLFASKAVLYLSCTFFNSKFERWSQEMPSEIEIRWPYDEVKQFLEILHSRVSPKTLDIGKEEVVGLFETADFFHCDVIRNRCLEVFKENASPEMAWIVLKLFNCGPQLKATFMEILHSMTPQDIRDTLRIKDAAPHFCKEDVRSVLRLLGASDREAQGRSHHEQYFDVRLGLKRDLKDLKEKIAFTKKWRLADVVLMTENSNGKKLFSNQAMLSGASPYFDKIFDRTVARTKERKMVEVEVPVDYEIMWLILGAIHLSGNAEGYISSYLSDNKHIRRDVWAAVSKEKLDFDCVRRIVIDSFNVYIKTIEFDEACSLPEMDENVKVKLADKLSDIEDWVYMSCDDAACTRNRKVLGKGKMVLCYASRNKPILSMTVFCKIIDLIMKKR